MAGRQSSSPQSTGHVPVLYLTILLLVSPKQQELYCKLNSVKFKKKKSSVLTADALKAPKAIILESSGKERGKPNPKSPCMLLWGKVLGLLALFAHELCNLAGFIKTKRINLISNWGSIYFSLCLNKSRIAALRWI